MMLPLFAELCAGTAALSLRLHGGKNARPPVSRMGNKQGYASAILRTLGLRSGSGAARYLWCEPDDGCRLLLASYTDAELRSKAAEIIRSWADEDPRKLWDRLRAEGPVKSPPVDPREVARWMRIVTANRLIPVHYERGRWCNSARNTGDKGGISFGGDDFCTPIESLASATETLPTLPATIAPDARAVDPREVARWVLRASWSYEQGNTKTGFVGPGDRRQDTRAVAVAVARLPTLPASILPDARAVDPPQLPPGSVVYIDPPYVNTTGYAHDLGRDAVCELAERWASAGAWVVISEAEPLAELGWHQVEITGERVGQKRTFSKQQREYLTMSQPPLWRPSEQRTLFTMAAK